jgi:hypothetical protein
MGKPTDVRPGDLAGPDGEPPAEFYRPGRPFGENPDPLPWVPTQQDRPGSDDGGPASGGQ